MITEEEKYKAYTFNFAGFALMTPAGKVVLDFSELFKTVGLSWVIFHGTVSILLFLLGLTFIKIGRSILHERRRGKIHDS